MQRSTLNYFRPNWAKSLPLDEALGIFILSFSIYIYTKLHSCFAGTTSKTKNQAVLLKRLKNTFVWSYDKYRHCLSWFGSLLTLDSRILGSIWRGTASMFCSKWHNYFGWQKAIEEWLAGAVDPCIFGTKLKDWGQIVHGMNLIFPWF